MKRKNEFFGAGFGVFFCGLIFSLCTADALALSCGDILVTDIKLDSSIDCKSNEPGLFIGADNVTIDLNGFTIQGGSDHFGIFSDGYSNLKVINGGISGFASGVYVEEGTGIEIKQVSLTNQSVDSVVILHSQFVSINNVQISLPESSGSAIFLVGIEDAKVRSVTVSGGGYGVLSGDSRDFMVTDSFFTDIANEGVGVRIVNNDGAIVRHNRIVGSRESDGTSNCYSGIDVVDGPSNAVQIHDNVIIKCGWGIFIGDFEPAISGLLIQKNLVFDNRAGIFVLGLEHSLLLGNRVHFNEDAGIGLNGGSTANKVMHNIVTGNGLTDMSHDESSTANKWLGNTCETADEGDEIDCP